MGIGDYIEMGIKQAGTATALAKLLDQSDSVLRAARRGERGLPTYACISLAKLIKATPLEVIAASELMTEKREDRRAIFLPFVQGAKHLASAKNSLLPGKKV